MSGHSLLDFKLPGQLHLCNCRLVKRLKENINEARALVWGECLTKLSKLVDFFIHKNLRKPMVTVYTD